MRDAQGSDLRYLVLLADQELVGFVLLVFRRPAYWSDGSDTTRLPQIVDLQVAETRRGQGLGTAFMAEIEKIATQAGYRQLYLSVDPVDNPRTYALYQRLGYQALQAEPYRSHWEFTDSAGQCHHGEEWALDMVKQLAEAP
jgi:GNAT superfamily N-acetyltransferase